MKHWKAWVGLILLFLVGFAAGFLVCGGIVKHRMDDLIRGDMEATKNIILHRLERRLDLTEEQEALIAEDLERAAAEFDELRQEHFPKVKALVHKTAQRIGKRLTPEQRKEFQELLERLKRFHPPLEE